MSAFICNLHHSCSRSWFPLDVGPCVAKVCRQFLNDGGIDVIDWPVSSADLKLIEHLSVIMCWCIQHHSIAPQTVQEVTDSLIQM